MLYKTYIAVIFLAFYTLLSSTVKAQECDGNVGENIFTEGDFGSGPNNIFPTDPGIAPGYTYSTNPPPNDGSYCLTNDIKPWNNQWGWVEIQDNSTDPQGYMMIVNASYETGLFYEQEVTGLCENTLYYFSVDVHNLHFGPDLIRPDLSFLRDNEVTFMTGKIPENNTWITFGQQFITKPGQETVTLALRNNAPGGIGNDIALDNIRFLPCGPEALILPAEIANICEDGDPIVLEATIIGTEYNTPQFQWQQSFDGGLTWMNLDGETASTFTHTDLNAGLYFYRYLLANDTEYILNSKCRVVSNVKMISVVPKYSMYIDSICMGLELQVNENIYTESGTYVDTLQNFLGCDSIVTLQLAVVSDPGIQVELNQMDPTCWNGNDGMIEITDFINITEPFDVFINGVGAPNNYLAKNLYSGIYSYSIIDRYGCEGLFDVILDEPEQYLVDLGPDLEVELGETVEIFAVTSETAYGFLWETEQELDCEEDCDEQVYIPANSSWLFVTSENEFGCPAKDSIYIRVIKKRKIYLPNTFSPNEDNVNDLFTITGIAPNVKTIEVFRIYSRWGEILFEIDSDIEVVSASWDGTVKGRAANSGVYTYYAEVNFLDGEKVIYTGSVMLLR